MVIFQQNNITTNTNVIIKIKKFESKQHITRNGESKHLIASVSSGLSL